MLAPALPRAGCSLPSLGSSCTPERPLPFLGPLLDGPGCSSSLSAASADSSGSSFTTAALRPLLLFTRLDSRQTQRNGIFDPARTPLTKPVSTAKLPGESFGSGRTVAAGAAKCLIVSEASEKIGQSELTGCWLWHCALFRQSRRHWRSSPPRRSASARRAASTFSVGPTGRT